MNEELFNKTDKRIPLSDVVKIGNYEEVEGLALSSITKNEKDGEKLDGLILYGYETKFNSGTNTNGERYTKECLDKFINEYYVGKGFNMPLTIQHKDDITHLAGRVLILEVNSVGFYFVCYIPKTYYYYNETKNLIKNGILQGLSKEGWALQSTIVTDKTTGEFKYIQVDEMMMTAVSLVCTPANGNSLESAKEVQNALNFKNNTITEKADDAFSAMFN